MSNHTTTSPELIRPSESRSELDADATRIQSNDIADKLNESITECEILRREVLELRRNLHEAQDMIFSLQPRYERITGTDASTEFSCLCEVIEEWLQSNLSDDICDRALFKEKGSLGQPAKNFLNLISLPGKEAYLIPDSDEYNVLAGIMRFLYDEIFNTPFYCPLPGGQLDFVKNLEKSLANVEPRRGKKGMHRPNLYITD